MVSTGSRLYVHGVPDYTRLYISAKISSFGSGPRYVCVYFSSVRLRKVIIASRTKMIASLCKPCTILAFTGSSSCMNTVHVIDACVGDEMYKKFQNAETWRRRDGLSRFVAACRNGSNFLSSSCGVRFLRRLHLRNFFHCCLYFRV